jgi:hypothetical protein
LLEEVTTTLLTVGTRAAASRKVITIEMAGWIISSWYFSVYPCIHSSTNNLPYLV